MQSVLLLKNIHNLFINKKSHDPGWAWRLRDQYPQELLYTFKCADLSDGTFMCGAQITFTENNKRNWKIKVNLFEIVVILPNLFYLT